MAANAEVNKRNAQRSTGPRTITGKGRVSTNAVKHGAYAEALFMLGESEEDFAKLKAGMEESFSPVGPLETSMVERLVSLWWRMDRTKTAANQHLWMKARRTMNLHLQYPEDRGLLGEALAMDADECRFAGGWNIEEQERLLRHEMTLERAFFKTLHELERVQDKRAGLIVPPIPTLDLNITGLRD